MKSGQDGRQERTGLGGVGRDPDTTGLHVPPVRQAPRRGEGGGPRGVAAREAGEQGQGFSGKN